MTEQQAGTALTFQLGLGLLQRQFQFIFLMGRVGSQPLQRSKHLTPFAYCCCRASSVLSHCLAFRLQVNQGSAGLLSSAFSLALQLGRDGNVGSIVLQGADFRFE